MSLIHDVAPGRPPAYRDAARFAVACTASAVVRERGGHRAAARRLRVLAHQATHPDPHEDRAEDRDVGSTSGRPVHRH